MATLNGYILRELLRIFLLTQVALAALVMLAGGIVNVVRGAGIGSADIFGFLPLLLPIVITLTMPIAAMFATTMVYGRLASDNELVACRAAGINVHRLFLPAGLLAVFVGLFTLLAINFVIPGFMKRLDLLVRANLHELAYQQLRAKGYARWQERYFVTAERVHRELDEVQLRAQGFDVGPEYRYLRLDNMTVAELENGVLKRFTAAAVGLCQFDNSQPTVRLTAWARDGYDFQPPRTLVKVDGQRIGSVDAPFSFPAKPSWADLNTLRLWREAPWLFDRIAARVDHFVAELAVQRFYAACHAAFVRDGVLILTDDQDQRYELRAARVLPDRENRPAFADATIMLARAGAGQPQRYTAPRAEVIARAPRSAMQRGAAPSAGVVVSGVPRASGVLAELRLISESGRPVRSFASRAGGRGGRDSETLHLDIRLPPEISESIQQLDPAVIFDPDHPLDGSELLVDQRAGLWSEAGLLLRKLNGLIHSRLSYSCSPLVTILMAAALGAIFRGARTLSAFGLACVPTAFVAILTLMGKNLADNEGTESLGIGVIWSGLALTALADYLIIRFGVPR